MKHRFPALALICAVLTLASACTQPERQQLATNATLDLLAAGEGYLTGGKAGAVTALTAQELTNLRARRATATSGK